MIPLDLEILFIHLNNWWIRIAVTEAMTVPGHVETFLMGQI